MYWIFSGRVYLSSSEIFKQSVQFLQKISKWRSPRRAGGILAQSSRLVAEASSQSSSQWHDLMPSTDSCRFGLKFGPVTRASSPSSWECHAPPDATVLRRWVSEELFLTWALLGLAPAASCPGVNSSFTEEWEWVTSPPPQAKNYSHFIPFSWFF